MNATADLSQLDPSGATLRAFNAWWRAMIDGALERILPEALPSDPKLVEAMRYAVLAGPGKRFRPLLCVMAAEACGGEGLTALPAACAIELLHASSLVLDDLPAMDNGLLRRGLPSCHVAFGEALSILAVEALIALALELVLQQGTVDQPRTLLETPIASFESRFPGLSRINAPRSLSVLAMLSRVIGAQGLAGGQATDMRAEGQDIGADALVQLHARKTGSLIQAAAAAGAIVVGAETWKVEALARYGAALGQLYQIVDDLLSETGEAQVLGKEPGSDRVRQKATYPRYFGLEGAQRAADEALAEALAALSAFGEEGMTLRILATFARMRSH